MGWIRSFIIKGYLGWSGGFGHALLRIILVYRDGSGGFSHSLLRNILVGLVDSMARSLSLVRTGLLDWAQSHALFRNGLDWGGIDEMGMFLHAYTLKSLG